MTKKPDTNTIITSLAVAAVVGIAAYAAFKTLRAVNKLDELDLDFGNDDMLSSLFKNKDNK